MRITWYGGTRVVDVWRPDVGIAVGHLETVPRLVSLSMTTPTCASPKIASVALVTGEDEPR